MKFFKMEACLNEKIGDTDIYLSEHAVLAVFPLNEGEAFDVGYRTAFIATTEKLYAVRAPIEDFLS